AGAALAVARASAMARRGTEVACPSLVAAQHDAADRLFISRSVRLVASARAAVPFTLGTWRPLVGLPEGAGRWPEARPRMVVLHGMAHPPRGARAAPLLGRAARALHWWNPLAWLAAARLDREREIACDDRVVAAGATPSDYAGLLLDAARELRRRAALPRAALAIVRP